MLFGFLWIAAMSRRVVPAGEEQEGEGTEDYALDSDQEDTSHPEDRGPAVRSKRLSKGHLFKTKNSRPMGPRSHFHINTGSLDEESTSQDLQTPGTAKQLVRVMQSLDLELRDLKQGQNTLQAQMAQVIEQQALMADMIRRLLSPLEAPQRHHIQPQVPAIPVFQRMEDSE
jgi:hypothetical protein